MDEHTLKELQYNRGIFFIILLMIYSLALYWIKPVPANLELSRVLGQTIGVNCHDTQTDAARAVCAHYCATNLRQDAEIIACMVGVYEVIYEEQFNAQELLDPTIREIETPVS